MTNSELTTISLDNLALVQGGVTRQDFQNFGGQAAEVGVVAGGAAVGTALGGPGGAAVGAVGAEVLNRTGVSNRVGQAVGGAVYDAGAAVGRGVSNAYNGARRAVGF